MTVKKTWQGISWKDSMKFTVQMFLKCFVTWKLWHGQCSSMWDWMKVELIGQESEVNVMLLNTKDFFTV